MIKQYKGQSLVEFALILPLLLLVILSLIDAAFLIQAYLAVNHAAREATRFASAYQPNQGECLDFNGDGTIVGEGYPGCPTNANETDNEYFTRRVELIKSRAIEAAAGLRYETICKDNACILNNVHESGMIGVRVWGFQDFNGTEQIDKPGLQGLPVRVQVVHNVPLVVYGTLLPNAYVTVGGVTEMINEGVQVSQPGVLPPPFGTVPPIIDPGTTPGTEEPTPPPGSTPTFTPTPTPPPVYHLTLDFETATNILPTDREHQFAALVTDADNRPASGAEVTFKTNEGSFNYSGNGLQTIINPTNSSGQAITAIYSNRPATATIQAWLDYNGNGAIDGTEPSDTATKIWRAEGPYLDVTNYNPAPMDVIGASLMDHPALNNPYSLWWCPASPTSTQIISRVATPLNVDPGTWDYLGVDVQIPLGVSGEYYLESHTGDGGANGCTQNGTLIARSDKIRIAKLPPDLEIESITLISGTNYAPAAPITLAIVIRNQTPVSVTGGPFDLDVYLDQTDPPAVRQLGKIKQWIGTMGPLSTRTITAVVTAYKLGAHNLWGQVDTTDYIEESNETNNVYGSVPFTITDCIPDLIVSDNFNDNALASKWTAQAIGNPSPVGSDAETGGALTVNAAGPIGGTSDKFRFLSQSISGDFRATVRVDSTPSDSTARAGIMARSTNAANSAYAMAARSSSNTYLQYRTSTGSNTSATNASSTNKYLQLRRNGNAYAVYRSSDGKTWNQIGTTTTVNLGASVLLGLATANKSGTLGTGKYDDFNVCRPVANLVPEPPPDQIYPPGLVQCTELLVASGFEGNAGAVFQFWRAGPQGGYQRTSSQFYQGSFAMRLHATLGVYPCQQNILQPYLYQAVELPQEVFTHSTLVATGRYYVEGSTFECSYPNSPDVDDVLSLRLQNQSGSDLAPGQQILNGGAVTRTWHYKAITLSQNINLQPYAGQNVRIQWDASNDGDSYGTFFYVDNLSAQLCTKWEIPPEVPDSSSIGGLVTTRSENNVPTPLPGTDVWAYTQGGTIYHTRSIHDGTYHFYNVPPGTYIIYAEAWVSGQLRTVTTEVTVSANQRNYSVNLLLQ